MATWYYFDTNGDRVGPIRGRQLVQLAQQGTVTRDTFVEDQEGRIGAAKNVRNLAFPSPPSPPAAKPPASWYYYNESGKKVGPMSSATLKELVQRRVITRKTVLKDGQGNKGTAGNVKGLTFPETSPAPVARPTFATSWYYYDESGRKVGPMPTATLKEFIKRGLVTRKTVLKDSNGHKTFAGNVKSLAFPEISLPPQPAEPNPFTPVAPPSVVKVPFTPRAKKRSPWGLGLAGLVGLLLALVVIGLVWKMLPSNHSTPSLQEELEKFVAGLELNIVAIAESGLASGEPFKATMRTAATLYEFVDNDSAQKILEINFHEAEFKEAMENFQKMSESDQGHILDVMGISPDRLQLQFYDVLVPEGEKITIELTKYGNEVLHGPFCYKDKRFKKEECFLTSEKFRLDDWETPTEVKRISESRKLFIQTVNETASKERGEGEE
ncbi:MAG: DUF4339 domain-containing protein [Planctomycetaceae bacterium]|nr:DUF4339 domain-containing protein [Planctomycetaceae bacterium]